MAVKWNYIRNETFYTGLSSDMKPDNPPVGSRFWETDTDIIYTHTGTSWDAGYGENVILSSNAEIRIMGEEDGQFYHIQSDKYGHLVPLEYIHYLVHDRIAYTLSHTFLGVAINGFSRIRIKTLSKALHFEINYNADLKCRIKTYASPTIATAGTLFEPFNRIIGYTGTKEFQMYLSPTFTGGILRGNDFSGSNTGQGSGAVRAGGGRNGGIESVLIPNQEYIIEFQNVGDAISDIGVIINCYERPYTA